MGVAVVHLNGYPGTGKRTIALALAAQGRAADPPRRLVVLDNHLTSNAVLAALDIGLNEPVPAVAWERVALVRDVVVDAIRDLAPPDATYVATNVMTRASIDASAVRLRALATDRGGAYVPVVLRCDEAELRRRVVGPDRAALHKWTDVDGVVAYAATNELDVPDDSHLLDLDVTSLTADQAAARILAHLGTVRADLSGA